jgi:hypothetical protein
MGLEAECVVRSGNHVSQGKAFLETDHLLIRSEFRLLIPFNDMTRVTAENGQLLVSYPDGQIILDLGPAADKWAKKILNPPLRLDKLGVKPDLQVAILGIDDPAFRGEVLTRTADVSSKPTEGVDLVFLGAETKAMLSTLPSLHHVLKPTGGIWVVYPKGVPQITEAEVRNAGKEAGLVDTKVVRSPTTHGIQTDDPACSAESREEMSNATTPKRICSHNERVWQATLTGPMLSFQINESMLLLENLSGKWSFLVVSCSRMYMISSRCGAKGVLHNYVSSREN